MSCFGDYVGKATRLLRRDPFVHRDVGRELEAHLEDAAAEARADGAPEREAEERALKAFGDPEALAEQLYEANRRRMRLRWWGKWATRLVLVPAALALAVAVGIYGFGIAWRVAHAPGHGGDLFMSLSAYRRPSPRGDLSDQERWLYEQVVRDETPGLETVRTVRERFPDDPVVHAFYVRHLADHYEAEPDRMSAEWMAALRRGRELDPDNALYDYLLAYALLARATETADEKGITFDFRAKGWRASEDPVEVELPTLRIIDQDTFLRAVHAARSGFRRPHCTSRAQGWAARLQGLWVEPETYRELLTQWAYHAGTLMPHLQHLPEFATKLPASVLLLAERGSESQAATLALHMERPGTQLGADSSFLIQMLVARWMLNRTGGAAPVILRRMGQKGLAEAAEQTFQSRLDAYARILPTKKHQDALGTALLEQGGIVAQTVMPALPGIEAEPLIDATRLAEHILTERIVLAGLLALGSLVLLLLATASVWSAWRHREPDERPMLLFVGWRRLGLVLILGIALPVALYALETRVAPWRSLRYGINVVLAQRVAELAMAVALVVLITCVAAYRAVRGRCEEAGLPVPPRGHFNPLRSRLSADMSLLLALAFGVAAAGVLAGSTEAPGLSLFTVALTVAALLFLPIFLLWQVAHPGYSARSLGAIARDLWKAARGTPVWLVFLGLVVLGSGGFLLYGTYSIPSRLDLAVIFSIAFGLPILVYAFAKTTFATPVPEMKRFRRTLIRSVIPVVAACVLVLGMLANLYLSHAEAAALKPMTRTGYHWYDELEITGFADYREHLREVNRRWLGERGSGPAAALE